MTRMTFGKFCNAVLLLALLIAVSISTIQLLKAQKSVFTASIKEVSYQKEVPVTITGCCGSAAQMKMTVTEIKFDRSVKIDSVSTSTVWLDSTTANFSDLMQNKNWKYKGCQATNPNRHSAVLIICGLIPKT